MNRPTPPQQQQHQQQPYITTMMMNLIMERNRKQQKQQCTYKSEMFLSNNYCPFLFNDDNTCNATTKTIDHKKRKFDSLSLLSALGASPEELKPSKNSLLTPEELEAAIPKTQMKNPRLDVDCPRQHC